MTQTMSLMQRQMRFRALPLAALAWSLAACTSTEEPTSVSETPASAVAVPPVFSSSGSGGIPFGMWALPTSEFGAVYTGAHRNIAPGGLLKELAAIKARGGRIVLAMAGNQKYFKDADGHFDFNKWKARVDRYRAVDFTSYIEDGTLIGHYILDEPNDPANWNGQTVDGPAVEAIAAYSKHLWPTLPAIVRVSPEYLAQWGKIYRNLDAAWAQYTTRFHEPGPYLKRQVSAAQSVGLALVTGMNTRLGNKLDNGEKVSFSAELVRSAGSALLADYYPCAFINWEYVPDYMARADIQAAMKDLSSLAAQHASRSCRGSGSGDPPPPPPPPPTNNPPVPAFDIPSCLAASPCQFTSKSTDDGNIASTSWNFGDGSTSTETNPSHTFAAANTYTVTLRVTDNGGLSRSIAPSVVIRTRANQPPSAHFTAPTCTVGAPCQFTDASTDSDGTISSYLWAFGSGVTATAANPSPTFSAAGPVSVTLRVTDNSGGTNSITQTVTVKPPNTPPTAGFTVARCIAETACQFTDASQDDGNIGSRSWDFGSGSPSSETNPSFTYPSAGTYSVTLTVTDNDGATNSATQSVAVARATLPGNQTISLKLAMATIKGVEKMKFTWTGATSATVDVYRNGEFRATIENMGKMVRAPSGYKETSYVYQICETGTDRCSNAVSSNGSNPPPPPPPPPPPAGLQLTSGVQALPIAGIVLDWSGANGATVDLYRDGRLFKTVPNDGNHLNSNRIQSGSTYAFKVCETGTTNCSNTVSATMP